MKRQNAKAQAQNTKAQAQSTEERPELKFYDKPIVKAVSKTITRYQLSEGVLLDICESDNGDYGTLNVYGLAVRVSYREITKGERIGEVFISYPQYKAKDGTYKAFVNSYSKKLNEAIKKALAYHYNDEGYVSVSEDEELPAFN